MNNQYTPASAIVHVTPADRNLQAAEHCKRDMELPFINNLQHSQRLEARRIHAVPTTAEMMDAEGSTVCESAHESLRVCIQTGKPCRFIAFVKPLTLSGCDDR